MQKGIADDGVPHKEWEGSEIKEQYDDPSVDPDYYFDLSDEDIYFTQGQSNTYNWQRYCR